MIERIGLECALLLPAVVLAVAWCVDRTAQRLEDQARRLWSLEVSVRMRRRMRGDMASRREGR